MHRFSSSLSFSRLLFLFYPPPLSLPTPPLWGRVSSRRERGGGGERGSTIDWSRLVIPPIDFESPLLLFLPLFRGGQKARLLTEPRLGFHRWIRRAIDGVGFFGMERWDKLIVFLSFLPFFFDFDTWYVLFWYVFEIKRRIWRACFSWYFFIKGK